jgi:hypothetical protein
VLQTRYLVVKPSTWWIEPSAQCDTLSTTEWRNLQTRLPTNDTKWCVNYSERAVEFSGDAREYPSDSEHDPKSEIPGSCRLVMLTQLRLPFDLGCCTSKKTSWCVTPPFPDSILGNISKHCESCGTRKKLVGSDIQLESRIQPMPGLKSGNTPTATSPNLTEFSWDLHEWLMRQLEERELQGGSRSFLSDTSNVGVTNTISRPILAKRLSRGGCLVPRYFWIQVPVHCEYGTKNTLRIIYFSHAVTCKTGFLAY